MTEALFHHVWAERLFRSDFLTTTEGIPLRIHSSGALHVGDGPDFRHATISLDHLRWEGDIELHVRCRDWYHHRHHQDPAYNNVILHVVLMPEHAAPVRRQDGTFAPTMVLFPHVNAQLPELLRQSAFRGKLACHGQAKRVSADVIDAQFREAESRYFDAKQHDLLRFYDSSLGLSAGWMRMFRKACFDVLGISLNRGAMCELHDKMEQSSPLFSTPDEAVMWVQQLAFGQIDSPRWDKSGSRPDNQPLKRVKQAAMIWYRLQGLEPDSVDWDHLIAGLQLGQERRTVLYRNAWLPAISLLAQWSGDRQRQHHVVELWMERAWKVPNAVSSPFKQAGFPESIVGKSSGTTWQLRERCRKSGCAECKIMQTLIRS